MPTSNMCLNFLIEINALLAEKIIIIENKNEGKFLDPALHLNPEQD